MMSMKSTLAALTLLPCAAGAQSYGVSGSVNASATYERFGQATETSYLVDNLSIYDRPQALLPNPLDKLARVGNGGTATTQLLASIGSLKAYSSAAYPYGYDAQGHALFAGYASATAQGSFVDTLLVAGAGLAVGTPVSYRVDFSINGTLSSPSFEIGGFLSASAGAEVRLNDLQSGQQVRLGWDASRQAEGLYSLTLATEVGHTLQIVGFLNTQASVTHYAQLGRSAEADFYHSALYTLAPSVDGLNTVGASGHDFLAPVPEPASAVLAALGLALLALRRRAAPLLRRCARPVS